MIFMFIDVSLCFMFHKMNGYVFLSDDACLWSKKNGGYVQCKVV